MYIEFDEADIITVRINSHGKTPIVVFCKNGNHFHWWKLMKITEWGNLWIPSEMRK